MNRPLSRLSHLLLASTVLLSAVAIAAEPAPRDSATGQSSGKRMYKPYTASAQSAPAGQSAACAAAGVQPDKLASDPEEGGQVTAAKAKGATTVSNMTVTKRTDTASAKPMAAQAAGAASTCAPLQH